MISMKQERTLLMKIVPSGALDTEGGKIMRDLVWISRSSVMRLGESPSRLCRSACLSLKAGQLTLLSNMKNAPVVEPRRTRWGWNSRNRYEELDHHSLYVPGL